MNRGLVVKALRESWRTTVMFGVGLLLAELALSYVLPTYQEQMSTMFTQLAFGQDVIRALLGTDVAGGLGPEVFSTFAWVHPVVLALLWTHAIMFCTRIPAAEVDRGTIDVLLSLPISRRELYRSETTVWLVSGLVVLLLGVAGNALGSLNLSPELRPDPSRAAIVGVNLFCLYFVVGAMAWLASSMSDRRGRAVGVVFALVLGSFLLNFLTQFWTIADKLSFLGILNYYKPVIILRDGSWPLGDIAVLAGAGLVLWITAGIVFTRRDLTTI